MNTKYKYYYLSFFAIFITGSLFLITNTNQNIEQLVENRYKEHANTMSENINTLVEQKKESNKNMVILLSNSTDIAKRVEKNDFEDNNFKYLLKTLKQKGKFKNVWLHIVNKEGVSVYRSWSKKRGDTIIDVRDDLKQLYKDPKLIASISVGKFDMTFKAISPIYDQNNTFLGFVEIISKFNSISKQIESKGDDIVILADKKYTKNLQFPWSEKFIDEYYIANIDVKDSSIAILKDIQLNNILNKHYLLNEKYKKLLVNTKIVNNDKQTIGYAITLTPHSSIILDDIMGLKFEALLDITVILLLLLFIAYLIESKRKESLLNEEIKKNLDDLNIQNILLESQQQTIQREINFTNKILNSQTNFTLVTDGKYLVKVNDAMLHFFGYSSLEEFHKDNDCICDFFIEEKNYLTKIKDGKTWVEILFEDINKTHYAKIKDLNNTIHTFELSIKNNDSILYNNEKLYVIIMSDVTQYFALLERLEKEQERVKLAIDGTSTGLFDWYIQKNDIYFSDKYKELIGYSPEELEDSFETWERLVHPDDIEKTKQHLNNYLEQKIDSYEVEFRMKHKKDYWVWINARGKVSRDLDGKPLRMVGFHSDISFYKKQEEEYLRQSKMATLGEMLENIAHQWRQPLTGILNITSILELGAKKDKLVPEKVLSHTQNIQKYVMYLSETIDTFRNFLNTKDQSFENVVLQESISNTIKLINTRLTQENISLIQNIDTKNPIHYSLIKNEFIQVLMNIFNNAIDILKEEQKQDPWIKISLYEDKNKIFLLIEDNGGGIPDNILDKIFEPYFTTKHKAQGTGIGLYMCYKIINEKLSGNLSAKNTENGAQFIIEFDRK